MLIVKLSQRAAQFYIVMFQIINFFYKLNDAEYIH